MTSHHFQGWGPDQTTVTAQGCEVAVAIPASGTLVLTSPRPPGPFTEGPPRSHCWALSTKGPAIQPFHLLTNGLGGQ